MVTPEPSALSVGDVLGAVPLGPVVYDALVDVVDRAGAATVRVTKSQVAFRRRTGFCWVWLPGRYLSGPVADVVVSIALPVPDPSPRWKQVVRVGAGRWMHHLEVRSAEEIDDEVAGWVARAYELAG